MLKHDNDIELCEAYMLYHDVLAGMRSTDSRKLYLHSSQSMSTERQSIAYTIYHRAKE